MNTLALARIRAFIAAAFGALGVGIAVQLLLKPVPFNQKIMGLAFAGVLIALGAVRVRGYWRMRRAVQP